MNVLWRITQIAACLYALLPALCFAQSLDGVESAQRALAKTRQPWYDADSDGLKPLIVAEGQEAKRSDWRGTDRPDWDWQWNWGGGGPSFSWVGELLKVIAWIVLIGLLAVLIYALVQAFLNINSSEETAVAAGKLEEEGHQTDEQRIENLPINLRKKTGDFLDIARGYYDEGNYAEAIIYLFSHRLILLDRAGCIRLTKGKTNRQYLIELENSNELQRILGQTMVAFEDVFFGSHTLTRDRFEHCWQRNENFEALLQQVLV